MLVCPSCNYHRPEPRGLVKDAICGNCDTDIYYSDETRVQIVKKNMETDFVPLIVGEDVKRYSLQTKHYIKKNVTGINYKNKEEMKTPKILIRKTGLGINATLDYNGNLTSQTVYHFFVKDIFGAVYSNEYILGVLNSRVMLYYYLKKYGDNEWKSHPYITQKVIKQLPIPLINSKSIIDTNQAKAIHDAVVKLLKSDGNSFELDLEIERLVAGLYGLTEKECFVINDTIKSAQQLKSISALTLPEGVSIMPKKVL